MLDIELNLLILGCQRNDRESQRKLYYKFYDEMRNYILSKLDNMDNYDDAIDILNDGFLRVFKKIHLYSYKGSFEGWVKRIMYNELCNYFKKKNKDFLFFPETLHSSDVETQMDNLSFKCLLELIEKLPDKTKSVFSLFIEGLTHVEISKTLNINEGTSKWHVHEARVFLKSKILETEKV
jgi:RNA polymerase sigma factor (sigma-70 family)